MRNVSFKVTVFWKKSETFQSENILIPVFIGIWFLFAPAFVTTKPYYYLLYSQGAPFSLGTKAPSYPPPFLLWKDPGGQLLTFMSRTSLRIPWRLQPLFPQKIYWQSSWHVIRFDEYLLNERKTFYSKAWFNHLKVFLNSTERNNWLRCIHREFPHSPSLISSEYLESEFYSTSHLTV